MIFQWWFGQLLLGISNTIVIDGTADAWEWTRQFGNSCDDQVYSVAQDEADAVYVAGEVGVTLQGRSDMFLAKYDSSGKQQWTIQVGFQGRNCAYAVMVDTSNLVWIAGTLFTGPYHDMILFQYNANGDEPAEKVCQHYRPSSDDYAFAAVLASANSIYMAGKTADENAQSMLGDSDMILVKYDISQNVCSLGWSHRFSGDGSSSAFAVTSDSSGSVYMVGTTGKHEMVLLKYDSEGNLQWSRQHDPAGHASARGVAVDSSDAIYMTGYTNAAVDGQIPLGGYDIVLVKYNSSGDWEWTRQHGTEGDDYAFAVSVDSSDVVLVAGSTDASMDGQIWYGSSDMALLKFDESGVWLSTHQHGSSGYDAATAAISKHSNAMFLAGHTNDTLDRQQSFGEVDAVLVKFTNSSSAVTIVPTTRTTSTTTNTTSTSNTTILVTIAYARNSTISTNTSLASTQDLGTVVPIRNTTNASSTSTHAANIILPISNATNISATSTRIAKIPSPNSNSTNASATSTHGTSSLSPVSNTSTSTNTTFVFGDSIHTVKRNTSASTNTTFVSSISTRTDIINISLSTNRTYVSITGINTVTSNTSTSTNTTFVFGDNIHTVKRNTSASTNTTFVSSISTRTDIINISSSTNNTYVSITGISTVTSNTSTSTNTSAVSSTSVNTARRNTSTTTNHTFVFKTSINTGIRNTSVSKNVTLVSSASINSAIRNTSVSTNATFLSITSIDSFGIDIDTAIGNTSTSANTTIVSSTSSNAAIRNTSVSTNASCVSCTVINSHIGNSSASTNSTSIFRIGINTAISNTSTSINTIVFSSSINTTSNTSTSTKSTSALAIGTSTTTNNISGLTRNTSIFIITTTTIPLWGTASNTSSSPNSTFAFVISTSTTRNLAGTSSNLLNSTGSTFTLALGTVTTTVNAIGNTSITPNSTNVTFGIVTGIGIGVATSAAVFGITKIEPTSTNTSSIVTSASSTTIVVSVDKTTTSSTARGGTALVSKTSITSIQWINTHVLPTTTTIAAAVTTKIATSALSKAVSKLQNVTTLGEIASTTTALGVRTTTYARTSSDAPFSTPLRRDFGLFSSDQEEALDWIEAGIVNLTMDALVSGSSIEKTYSTPDGDLHVLLRVIPYRLISSGFNVTFGNTVLHFPPQLTLAVTSTNIESLVVTIKKHPVVAFRYGGDAMLGVHPTEVELGTVDTAGESHPLQIRHLSHPIKLELERIHNLPLEVPAVLECVFWNGDAWSKQGLFGNASSNKMTETLLCHSTHLSFFSAAWRPTGDSIHPASFYEGPILHFWFLLCAVTATCLVCFACIACRWFGSVEEPMLQVDGTHPMQDVIDSTQVVLHLEALPLTSEASQIAVSGAGDDTSYERIWNNKVVDLAYRGITVAHLLEFCERLGDDIMSHFDPDRSTTHDVVRQAIIPLTRQDKCTTSGHCIASSTNIPDRLDGTLGLNEVDIDCFMDRVWEESRQADVTMDINLLSRRITHPRGYIDSSVAQAVVASENTDIDVDLLTERIQQARDRSDFSDAMEASNIQLYADEYCAEFEIDIDVVVDGRQRELLSAHEVDCDLLLEEPQKTHVERKRGIDGVLHERPRQSPPNLDIDVDLLSEAKQKAVPQDNKSVRMHSARSAHGMQRLAEQHSEEARSVPGFAYATIVANGEQHIAEKMVTHFWGDTFLHLMAVVLADALKVEHYEPVAKMLSSRKFAEIGSMLKIMDVLSARYWLSPFSINQHTTICNESPPLDSLHFPIIACTCSVPKIHGGAECETNKFDAMMAFMATQLHSRSRQSFIQIVACDVDFAVLSRTWCIAELVEAGRLCMGQSLKIHSLQNLAVAWDMIEKINVIDSQASQHADKAFLLNKIDDVARFNSAAKMLMRRLATNVLEVHFQNDPPDCNSAVDGTVGDLREQHNMQCPLDCQLPTTLSSGMSSGKAEI